MPTRLSESEFLDWEKETQADFPERAIYYDPRMERVYLLYYEVNNGFMAPHYVMTEGIDLDGKEMLFKYSAFELGDFRNVTNLIEFHERATELSDAPEPLMN